jgi:serine/threonine-protein kinase
LLLPVLEAIAHVHASGFLHGDIKEEHILATGQLKPKLIDFGSARKITGTSQESPPVLDFTPEYASPELLRGEHLDSRSDLYSFGILMYRVLVGRHPYGLRSGLITEIADLVLNEEPQSAFTILSTANAHEFDDNIAKWGFRTKPNTIPG